jgi:hypothetical protein
MKLAYMGSRHLEELALVLIGWGHPKAPNTLE